jgi:hypothetical protein
VICKKVWSRLTIGIVCRGEFDNVESDDVESFETVQDSSDFSGGPSSGFWCSR